MDAHFGVYAVVIEEGRLLCVKKTRGPYQGQLDLPGGSPEPGESPEAALLRELLEETGGQLRDPGPWQPFKFQVDHDSKGAAIEFQHAGQWCRAELSGIRQDLPAKEDVAGLAWVALKDASQRTDLSPLVQEVLRSL